MYVLTDPGLKGNNIIKSLKVYGIAFLFFAIVSSIYMNHYSHTRDFYLFNILDSLIEFPIVAIGNGLLYPLFFKRRVDQPQS
ncbi:MAG: hypothetical protein V3U68_05050 [Bacteroidota bacterium]